MIDNKYKCNKCRGLCEEFIKRYRGCAYRGFDFKIITSPMRDDCIQIVHDTTSLSFSNIEESVDYLLDYSDLTLEDAIRLTKVFKNV